LGIREKVGGRRRKWAKRLTGGRIKSGWEKERENFWENRGIDIGEIEEGRDGNGRIFEEVLWKDKEEKDGRR